MLNERKLKVYSATRTSNNSSSWSHRTYYEVPEILLAGKWLESAGFSIADTVKVSVSHGRIIISMDDNS